MFFTAADCFELGRHAYNKGDHYHTILWMKQALETLDTEVEPTIEKAEVLDYLSYSTFEVSIRFLYRTSYY